MPVLDLEKEYPKKTIALQDIADVEYIVLETHDDGLVGSHYTTVTDSFKSPATDTPMSCSSIAMAATHTPSTVRAAAARNTSRLGTTYA